MLYIDALLEWYNMYHGCNPATLNIHIPGKQPIARRLAYEYKPGLWNWMESIRHIDVPDGHEVGDATTS